MHLNISAPQSTSHLTELVQRRQRDTENTVHSEICQPKSVFWIPLETGLSCKGGERWQKRGQGSNAMSCFLLACCRDVRPFSSCSQQAQRCSFQISEGPINHFPQSSTADKSIFCDLRGEAIQFLWYIFMWYFSLLTQQYTPWLLTNKLGHCNRSISASRSRLDQLRDGPAGSQREGPDSVLTSSYQCVWGKGWHLHFTLFKLTHLLNQRFVSQALPSPTLWRGLEPWHQVRAALWSLLSTTRIILKGLWTWCCQKPRGGEEPLVLQ